MRVSGGACKLARFFEGDESDDVVFVARVCVVRAVDTAWLLRWHVAAMFLQLSCVIVIATEHELLNS